MAVRVHGESVRHAVALWDIDENSPPRDCSTLFVEVERQDVAAMAVDDVHRVTRRRPADAIAYHQVIGDT